MLRHLCSLNSSLSFGAAMLRHICSLNNRMVFDFANCFGNCLLDRPYLLGTNGRCRSVRQNTELWENCPSWRLLPQSSKLCTPIIYFSCTKSSLRCAISHFLLTATFSSSLSTLCLSPLLGRSYTELYGETSTRRLFSLVNGVCFHFHFQTQIFFREGTILALVLPFGCYTVSHTYTL